MKIITLREQKLKICALATGLKEQLVDRASRLSRWWQWGGVEVGQQRDGGAVMCTGRQCDE